MRTAEKTFLMLAIVAVTMPGLCAESVRLVVDGGVLGQTWEGWGATDLFSFDGLEVEPEAGMPGIIPPEARRQILRMYYQDLGMTRVRFWPMGYEPVNDNDDPFQINDSAFIWKGRGTRPVNSVEPFCQDHLVMGAEFRFPAEPFTFYPSAHQWESWMTVNPSSPTWYWGKDAKFNPEMVEEYAEHALAAILFVKKTYGYEIPYWSLFNEPSNTARIDRKTTLALVLACGRRFKEYNLKTRLSICDDVTPEDSAPTIEYILANEEAREYVGALSYHRYRGDFVLEQVKPMLARVEKGELLVKEPVSFYASAARYGKSLWMSEICSYAREAGTNFDAGRARANHICDEINFGRVNAFDFMLCYFIRRSGFEEEAPIFLYFKDGKFASAEINPFGSWISHFTRYIRPGAVRMAAQSSDKLVKAVAFGQGGDRSITVVVINNRGQSVSLSLELTGLHRIPSSAARVRTSPEKLREKLSDIMLAGAYLTDELPAMSITTYLLR